MNTLSEIEEYYKAREQRLLEKLHQQEAALAAAAQTLKQWTETTEQRAARERAFKEELYRDSLTDAYNRRYYEEVARKTIGPAGVALMDADDFIEDAYILEVSSPGLGRQLKKEKDFKRSIGEDIDLHFYKGQKIPGGKNGKEVTVKDLTGTLLAFTTDTITIQTDFAPEYVVNRSEVSKVNLTIDF